MLQIPVERDRLRQRAVAAQNDFPVAGLDFENIFTGRRGDGFDHKIPAMPRRDALDQSAHGHVNFRGTGRQTLAKQRGKKSDWAINALRPGWTAV